LGLEGPGLDSLWPEEKRLAVPMKPGVESLNAAASAAVALTVMKMKTLENCRNRLNPGRPKPQIPAGPAEDENLEE
ncbi:MAG: hypothetical protein LBK52_07045, partial [Deltaproteobacteria bacterium]|nr:hypothetical protein [Deltaproteobacteria bacterium]